MVAKSRSVPVTFSLPADIKSISDRLADEDGRSRSSMMRILLVWAIQRCAEAGSWAELRRLRLVNPKESAKAKPDSRPDAKPDGHTSHSSSGR